MIRLILLSLILFGWFPASASAQQVAQEPLSLHPQNNRYFLFRGKPIVLVTSGEHYGLLLNGAFDFDRYFEELAAHGLNHSRVFSGAYREIESSFGITQNPLAPTDDDYLCPWKRTGKTHRDGGPIFDLRTWDTRYFARLHKMLASASQRGIVIEMCLFSPMYKPNLWDVNPMNIRNNINEVGDCGSKEVYTTKHDGLLRIQKQLAEKMVEELLPYDNVYIEICNEPYFGGVTEQWQNEIIDAVVAKQEALGSRTLVSINVANKTKVIQDPHPAVSIFNFHYCHPPIVVAENSGVTGVIGENETGFRGSADFLYRTEGWDFLVAGGGLYNNLDYSFSAKHPAGTLEGYKSPGGGGHRLRQQLGFLKQEFSRLPLPEIQPQPNLLVKVSDGLVAAAIGKPGHSYMVYVHVELPSKLKDQSAEKFRRSIRDAKLTMRLPSGRYRVTQLDPRERRRSEPSTIDADADAPAVVSLSEFATDAALLIQRQE